MLLWMIGKIEIPFVEEGRALEGICSGISGFINLYK